MSNDANFCSIFKIPLIEKCMTMAEWSYTWQSFGIWVTLIVGIVTVVKIWLDVNSNRQQKIDADKLDRTKFLLEQHRRLFDDQDLKDVLQHLDGDDEDLAQFHFWEKNRKFLVFIEEIQILINSKFLDETSCQYMFGYYANCAYNGKNFKAGIQFEEKHWGLFTKFANTYEKYEPIFKQNFVSEISI